MLAPMAYVLAFIAVVMVIQAVASVVFSGADRARRINRRLALMQSGMASDQVYTTLVRRPVGDRLSAAAPGLYNWISTYCRQSGLPLSPARLGAFIAAAALGLWIVSLTLLSAVTHGAVALNVVVSLIGAVGLAVMGGLAVVAFARAKRLAKFEEQLPIALDIIARAIRAGHPVISAMQLAAEEMGDPIGSEFGLVVDETTYGLEFREALVNLGHRTGSADAHYFAVCVGIQSQTGGNLAEVLGNLCAVIRGRQSLRLRVKALASEGKVSSQVLTALPVFLVSFLMLVQPTFYTTKFSDPIFWPTVVVISVLYIVGQVISYRIVNFKY